MRLTSKDKYPENNNCFTAEYWGVNVPTAFNKLANLEDIEDELGIELSVLFKAFKNGIWIKFNTGSTGEDKETGGQIVFVKVKAPYKTLAENIGYFRRLFEKEYAGNYGKTWALTKEELIND